MRRKVISQSGSTVLSSTPAYGRLYEVMQFQGHVLPDCKLTSLEVVLAARCFQLHNS